MSRRADPCRARERALFYNRVENGISVSLALRRERNQFRLRMEQAPGPRGSPHDPQAPAEGGLEAEPLLDTANVESCGASCWLWHFGHSAFCRPYTRASNEWSQSLQMYSKIGISPVP